MPGVRGDLRAGDRPHPQRFGGLRELHRAPDAIVVGDRERLMALLGSGGRQLVRMRGAVQEREAGVAMQLDVGSHQARCPNQFPRSRNTTSQRPSASASSK